LTEIHQDRDLSTEGKSKRLAVLAEEARKFKLAKSGAGERRFAVLMTLSRGNR